MAAADNPAPDPKVAELSALIAEIRERVRARHPEAGEGSIRVPDLLPILHARDAAYSKVASIGSVNPRRGGPLNTVIQALKRAVARALDWHVRDQVEFNRAAVSSLEAILEAMNENNRALRDLAGRIAALHPLAEQVHDTEAQWKAWRGEWERKLVVNEAQFLRSVADLQAAFHQRVTLAEANFRDVTNAQHTDFTAALDRATLDIQKRLWADLERIRIEYETVIHAELRVVRQRAALLAPEPAPTAPGSAPRAEPRYDAMKFADKFRGPEEYVREGQRYYVEKFRGCANVLDIGCGRGEFLELMREAGIPARGIELSDELVALCRRKGLDAEKADLFTYLNSLPDQSLDGIFTAQVVEHLPPELLPELVRSAHRTLRRQGVLVIETPNPESLAIFATHFYLDPTHTRPIPPALLAFYVEEQGFGQIEIRRFAPARQSIPELAALPDNVAERLFGSLDYAVIARRL